MIFKVEKVDITSIVGIQQLLITGPDILIQINIQKWKRVKFYEQKF